ncbi:ERD2 [Symbiodinium natans]|uniref:ERD2 protein n=1 Tax=Symbiodinium natans TaxID=878477 RepID=A0A812KSB0_9DINO|nr:ERD2 [Symbiodinium natans]
MQMRSSQRPARTSASLLHRALHSIINIIIIIIIIIMAAFTPNDDLESTDKFQYEIYLLGPCLLLGILCTEEYTLPEILWTTSIWLESVAIVPQLVLLQQMREVENLTSQFVATMGA